MSIAVSLLEPQALLVVFLYQKRTLDISAQILGKIFIFTKRFFKFYKPIFLQFKIYGLGGL